MKISKRHLHNEQLSEGHQGIPSLQRGHTGHHVIHENRINLTDDLHLWIGKEISLTNSAPMPIVLCCCVLTTGQLRHEMQGPSQVFWASIQLRLSQSWPLDRPELNRDESKPGCESLFRATSPARASLGGKGFPETLTWVITHCQWEPKVAIVPVPLTSQPFYSQLEMTRTVHKTCCLSGLHPQTPGTCLGHRFHEEKGFLELTKPHEDKLRLLIKNSGKWSQIKNTVKVCALGKNTKGQNSIFLKSAYKIIG